MYFLCSPNVHFTTNPGHIYGLAEFSHISSINSAIKSTSLPKEQSSCSICHLLNKSPAVCYIWKAAQKPQKWQKWAIEAEDKELIYVLYMHVQTDGAFCLNSKGRIWDFLWKLTTMVTLTARSLATCYNLLSGLPVGCHLCWCHKLLIRIISIIIWGYRTSITSSSMLTE